MSDATLWWMACGVAVAVEMLTGTFYLLMIALGLAAGAVAAHLGAGAAGQILAAALLGLAATGAWYVKRLRQPRDIPVSANPNVNLDIGETVQVDAWQPDGTAQVRYRGAQWTVQAAAGSGSVPTPGPHRVREMVGSRLIVEKL